MTLAFLQSNILSRTYRACRQHIVFAMVFSFLLNLLHLAPTLYMLVVYDKAMPTEGQMTLALVSVVLLFALGTLAVLDWMRSRILVRLSARLEGAMAGEILITILGDPRIPQAKLHILPGVGHLSPLEDPEAVAQQIEGFIDALAKTKRH